MDAIPMVSSSWLEAAVDVLEGTGASCQRLLRQSHLPTLIYGDASAVVPSRLMYGFLEGAARSQGLPDLGIRIGRHVAPRVVDIDSSVLRKPLRLCDVLDRLILQTAQDSSRALIWLHRDEARVEARIGYRGTFGTETPGFGIDEELVVSLLVEIIRRAAGSDWLPEKIQLVCDRPPSLGRTGLLSETFIVTSAATTEIVFPRHFLDLPLLPRGDSPLGRVAFHQVGGLEDLRDQDFASSLGRLLTSYFRDGSPDLRLASELAGTSPRSLQRRLHKQGTTYSHVLERSRREHSLRLLEESDLTAAEIGVEVGFRDPAIFQRAFRRWTGTTPGRFRKASRSVAERD